MASGGEVASKDTVAEDGPQVASQRTVSGKQRLPPWSQAQQLACFLPSVLTRNIIGNPRYTYAGQRACRSLDNTAVAWVKQ